MTGSEIRIGGRRAVGGRSGTMLLPQKRTRENREAGVRDSDQELCTAPVIFVHRTKGATKSTTQLKNPIDQKLEKIRDFIKPD